MRYISLIALSLAVLARPGVLLSQTSWYADPYNPHLAMHRVLDPSVLYDSTRSVYLLWASDGYRANWGVSLDGREWFDFENNGTSLLTMAFGVKFLHGLEVVRVDTAYYMYYTARDLNDSVWIGLATSPDGFSWRNHNGGSIIRVGAPGSWESEYVWYPKVVVVDGIFYMIYGGSDGSIGAVGLATSTDGITWQKYLGNPVLSHGGTSAPDENGVGSAGIEFKDGTFYLMFLGQDLAGKVTLSLATSTNCIDWSKYQGNPVLGPGTEGSWDSYARTGGAIRYAQGTWHYWYSGAYSSQTSSWYLGYASSVPLPLSASAVASDVPKEAKLCQNYPNPFNPSTTIKYELPTISMVTLAVYDLLGREMSVLVNERKNAGVHEVQFDASTLASGVYLYRLQAGDFVQSRKLVVLR